MTKLTDALDDMMAMMDRELVTDRTLATQQSDMWAVVQALAVLAADKTFGPAFNNAVDALTAKGHTRPEGAPTIVDVLLTECQRVRGG